MPTEAISIAAVKATMNRAATNYVLRAGSAKCENRDFDSTHFAKDLARLYLKRRKGVRTWVKRVCRGKDFAEIAVSRVRYSWTATMTTVSLFRDLGSAGAKEGNDKTRERARPGVGYEG